VTAHLAREIAAERFALDACQQDAARRLDQLAASLNDRGRRSWFHRKTSLPTARGLYLWGGVGRGKTSLMDLFFDSLRFAERERAHFYAFMQTIHAELRATASREEPLDAVAARLALRARVICLDEFMVTDITDAMLLGGLLSGLFRRGVILVATSNRPPQDLYRDGLQRERFLPAIALLQEHLEILHLDGGEDYRLRQLERAPSYWDSTASGSESEFRAAFQTMSGAASGPATLTIQGRPLQAEGIGHAAIWFDFQALCETARGAADYLELAQRYRTLFLSNVPIFGPANDDAARRFLMLIDALYDRGSALLLSAAAEPSMLYRGERLRFEFERAASRLIEMRSQQYLSRMIPGPA
jgi:cell division protein ZapE